MREIVLDTETTGLEPLKGHRILEIGCVELENHVATGKTFHVYINPQREVEEAAASIHGLTNDFLEDKPLFTEIIDDFLNFIQEDPLVIHNAPFDMGFINAEMTRAGFQTLPMTRAIDTLLMARKKFFGAPATLDALCKRFSIDASSRVNHGALLDAQLLAEVYLELCGGRQPDLDVLNGPGKKEVLLESGDDQKRVFREPRPHKETQEEAKAHHAFLEQIKNPIWKRS